MLRITCVIPLRQTRHLCRIPARAQRFYRYLHEERHYSQMALLGGLLAIPLTLGKTVGFLFNCTTSEFEMPRKVKV